MLLSPILFNLFLEKIMQETLYDHHTSISIGGRPICNLQYVDNNLMGGSNGELHDLINRFIDTTTAYGAEVSTEKMKITTNSMNIIIADISINSQRFEQVTSFKYLGATLRKNGTCSAEVGTTIATTVVAMARPNRIW